MTDEEWLVDYHSRFWRSSDARHGRSHYWCNELTMSDEEHLRILSIIDSQKFPMTLGNRGHFNGVVLVFMSAPVIPEDHPDFLCSVADIHLPQAKGLRSEPALDMGLETFVPIVTTEKNQSMLQWYRLPFPDTKRRRYEY